MDQPILKTDRLILRPYEIADAEEVKDLAGNSEVSKMTLNIPYPYELDMAKEWLSSHKKNWDMKSGLVYAVATIDNGELIGAVSLVEISGSNAELGYWIGQPHWGNGYCSEAVAALIKFSVSSLGITRIYAEHLACNPASGKVMIKCGLNHIATISKLNRYNVESNIETYEAVYT